MRKVTILAAVLVTAMFSSLALAESNTNKKVARSIDSLIETCVLCHGKTGNTKDATAPDSNNPNLGGQHRDYLLISMQRYQSGERDNAVMRGLLAGFTEDELRQLAKYYSQQEGVWDTAYPRFK